MNVGHWIRKNASTILTCLGAGGVVATVVLAIKATSRAIDKVQTAQIDKEEILNDDREGEVKKELTVIETVQTCWQDYIPTVAVLTASLVCIFGANVLDRGQQASMAAAYTALASAFEGYRDKVRAICGPGTDEMIEKAMEQEKWDAEDDRPPWDEVQTFYIEEQPQFFERTMEQVMQAEYHFNRNFILKGTVMLNELFDFLGLPHTEEGDRIGWNRYDGEAFYGYQWIDFSHRHYVADDNINVCAIDMPFPPHPFGECETIGEGGFIYPEPGMYGNVELIDF